MKFSLNGTWELAGSALAHPLTATVPGNIELDLHRAGIEPDPYTGTNSLAYRKYGMDTWHYRRTFRTPEGMAGPCTLRLDGVDGVAHLALNGTPCPHPLKNGLITHKLPVTLRPEGEENTLIITLTPFDAETVPEEPAAICHLPEAASNLWQRRPAHTYGWDIAPKFNLGGLWRDVTLEKPDADSAFDELWLRTVRLAADSAELDLYYVHTVRLEPDGGLRLRIRGTCGNSRFEEERPVCAPFGHIRFTLRNPKLWQPCGQGNPNLYTLEAELLRGNTCVGRHVTHAGIRTVTLEKSELNIAGTGYFYFTVNGRRVRIFGTNWVPADAFHSRDPGRLGNLLKLCSDSHCNMLRCWGGGVYESNDFYDYCDRNGILVWQDFMFSGHKYPQHRDFLEAVRMEAEWAVRNIRRHPCLALWCGDNECDQKYLAHGEDPRGNRINREVLPEVLARLDPTRPYLPSSPFLSDEAFRYADASQGAALTKLMPERHLWGSRESFQQPFYTACDAKFVSETGWHGCPSFRSLQSFISPDELRTAPVTLETPELALHSSNPWPGRGIPGRNSLMLRQNEEYFSDAPATLPEFILASQIAQGEAFKKMVEHYRLQPDCGGILWWNMADCWPQLSDAVVDYYFRKKLAYYYLMRSQQPFAVLCSDTAAFMSRVTAVNDTPTPKTGHVDVRDAETGTALFHGDFTVPAAAQTVLASLRSRRAVNRLWLIQWTLDDGTHGANHFISGNRVMSFAWYREHLSAIGALDRAFTLDGLEIVPDTGNSKG